MNNVLLYFLFPILFMFHELEEIAFLPNWSREQISNPKIPNKLKNMLSTNAQSFTLMVLEEYFLLVSISAICYLGNYPEFYLAVIAAYNIHVLGHIFQSIYLKKYVPGTGLGIITLIILMVISINYLPNLNVPMFIMFIPLSMLILVLNLSIVHRIF